MFVRNQTPYEPVLARGYLLDDLAVGCISVELIFHLGADGALVSGDDPGRLATDPPDIRREALWKGCSVTVFGHVRGPQSAPFVRTVEIAVGEHTHRLVVFGARHWSHSLGEIAATEPAPFALVPLSWTHAFGGTAKIEAGYFPGTELPHPGGAVPYPFNPVGTGFYLSAELAMGQPLPQIEHPQQLVKTPAERPIPAGCAPCPRLPQLRIPDAEAELPVDPLSLRPDDLLRALDASLRGKHHAPGPLILDRLEKGTPVSIRGAGEGFMRFNVPPPPLQVTAVLARGPSLKPRPRLRSLHVDADRRLVRLVWGYLFRYAPPNSPRLVNVAEAA